MFFPLVEKLLLRTFEFEYIQAPPSMQKCKKLDFAVFSESQGRENITRTKEFSFAENLLPLAINALQNNQALKCHLSEL